MPSETPSFEARAPRWRALCRAVMLTVCTATAMGCVSLPEPPPERALYVDLRSIIQTRARIDWVVDRDELVEASSAIMNTICRTPTPVRRSLYAWLNEQLVLEGGSAKAIYDANGGDLSAAREALTLERVRAALDFADTRVEKDCPFWLQPEPDFDGVQSNTHRFVVLAESMGSAQLVMQDGVVDLGGGGLGRIMPAWGITDRITLAFGLELGVASTFPKTDEGSRSVKPVIAGGIPAILRVHDGTFRYDLEMSAVGRATRNEFDGLRYGGRVAVGAGVATLRIAGVMPYVMAWAGYEYLLPGAGQSETHVVRAGSRVGFNWDP